MVVRHRRAGFRARARGARDARGARAVGHRTAPAGVQRGLQRGLRAGEEDGRRSESFNFTDEGDYRRADAGYRREYGNDDWYRTDFRRGFRRAIAPATTATARYGDGPATNGRATALANGRGNGHGGDAATTAPTAYRNDLAFQTGFNDGYEGGLDDGRDRRRNDPFAESRYRSGDHGYDRRYGPREAYKIRTATRSGRATSAVRGRAAQHTVTGRGGRSEDLEF